MGVETFIAEAPAGNTPDGAMSFLRQAINAPDRKEVEDMIKQMLMEHSFLTKIELKIGDTTKMIENGPKHEMFPEILEVVNIGLHVALIGPAGSGKSTVGQQIADALDLKYYLQNSVTGTHELAGYMDAHGKYNTTAFRKCFQEGGLMLIDEVDTSDPGALKWVNTALANGYAMFPDMPDPVFRHKDFRVIIAANTFGNGADRVYVGANQLDASTLDRFVFFDFGYDEKLEVMLSGNPKWAERVQSLRAAALSEKARIVISPRASQHGAKLLTLGWSQELVEDRVIWKGIDNELKSRIVKAANDNTMGLTANMKTIINGPKKKKAA